MVPISSTEVFKYNISTHMATPWLCQSFTHGFVETRPSKISIVLTILTSYHAHGVVFWKLIWGLKLPINYSFVAPCLKRTGEFSIAEGPRSIIMFHNAWIWWVSKLIMASTMVFSRANNSSFQSSTIYSGGNWAGSRTSLNQNINGYWIIKTFKI